MGTVRLRICSSGDDDVVGLVSVYFCDVCSGVSCITHDSGSVILIHTKHPIFGYESSTMLNTKCFVSLLSVVAPLPLALPPDQDLTPQAVRVGYAESNLAFDLSRQEMLPTMVFADYLRISFATTVVYR